VTWPKRGAAKCDEIVIRLLPHPSSPPSAAVQGRNASGNHTRRGRRGQGESTATAHGLCTLNYRGTRRLLQPFVLLFTVFQASFSLPSRVFLTSFLPPRVVARGGGGFRGVSRGVSSLGRDRVGGRGARVSRLFPFPRRLGAQKGCRRPGRHLAPLLLDAVSDWILRDSQTLYESRRGAFCFGGTLGARVGLA
jgi:hypothetical protein